MCRRRLFQRLQQAVEGLLRQHVHLVDQIDLETPTGRRVLGIVEDLADVIDTGSRRRVHLQEIDKAPGIDRDGTGAFATGRGTDTLLAVESLDENPRDGGLADSRVPVNRKA